jgi:hypothetical protein
MSDDEAKVRAACQQVLDRIYRACLACSHAKYRHDDMDCCVPGCKCLAFVEPSQPPPDDPAPECKACEDDYSFQCDVCQTVFCGEHAAAHKHERDDEAKVRDAGVTLDDNRAVVRLCEAYPDINALPGPVLDGIAQALANHHRAGFGAGRALGREEGARAVCEPWCGMSRWDERVPVDYGLYEVVYNADGSFSRVAAFCSYRCYAAAKAARGKP